MVFIWAWVTNVNLWFSEESFRHFWEHTTHLWESFDASHTSYLPFNLIVIKQAACLFIDSVPGYGIHHFSLYQTWVCFFFSQILNRIPVHPLYSSEFQPWYHFFYLKLHLFSSCLHNAGYFLVLHCIIQLDQFLKDTLHMVIIPQFFVKTIPVSHRTNSHTSN